MIFFKSSGLLGLDVILLKSFIVLHTFAMTFCSWLPLVNAEDMWKPFWQKQPPVLNWPQSWQDQIKVYFCHWSNKGSWETCSSSAVKVKAVNLEKLFALQVFRTGKVIAGDCYGENLQELGGELSEQVYNAWNTCIKLTLQVPRATNIYCVDMLLGCGISQASEIFLVRKQ